MLYKNTSPMPKRRTVAVTANEESSAEVAALRALMGLFCSVCDKPLKPSRGKQPHENGMVCCQHAHCPYCGAPDKERCQHLVAYRTSGHWCIAGLPEVDGAKIPEPPPLTSSSIIAYSEAQKQNAFGEAYPLLMTVYGAGYLKSQSEAISAGDLVRLVVRPDEEQKVGDNYFFFSADPMPGQKRLRATLKEDLLQGFEKLLSIPPDTTEFVGWNMAADTKSELVQAITFSPDSKTLVVTMAEHGMLYDINNPKEPGIRFAPTNNSNTEITQYRYCTFALDGKHFLLNSRVQSSSFVHQLYFCRTEVRDAKTGELRTSTDEFIYPSSSLEHGIHLFVDMDIQDQFLHEGKTVLTVRDRSINLYPVANVVSPVISPALRLPITHLAVAPDGETFAAAAGPFVVIWRVPQKAMDASIQPKE